MKELSQYITEYLIKKKVDKVRGGYKYTPKTKEELINNIKELLDKGEINLNCIDVSNITDMSGLFYDIPYSRHIDFDVSGWDVSNVKDMSYMFSNCSKFNCDLSNWDVSKVKNTSGMFKSCENFEGKGLENWDVSNMTNCNYMFDNCINFDCDLSLWDVHKVENAEEMFGICKKFTGKGLENWDVSNVQYMPYMFSNCENFTGKGLENWDVSNVQYMRLMFCNCKKLNVDLSKWNVKKARLQLTRMFYGCTSLKNIPRWYKE